MTNVVGVAVRCLAKATPLALQSLPALTGRRDGTASAVRYRPCEGHVLYTVPASQLSRSSHLGLIFSSLILFIERLKYISDNLLYVIRLIICRNKYILQI